MRTGETKVKDEVKKVLKKHGVWYFMYVPHGFGSGIADFTCCVPCPRLGVGLFISIECKARDGMQPTPLQEMQLKKVNAAMGKTMVVTPSNLIDLERWCEDVTKV